MTDDDIKPSEPQAGRWTLSHLILGICFFMPTCAAFGQVRSAGGGIVRYLAGVLTGLLLGGGIVTVNWKFGKFIWQNTKRCSTRAQSFIGLGIYALDLGWMIVGVILGSTLASVLIRHIDR